jgi:hypothetical protein
MKGWGNKRKGEEEKIVAADMVDKIGLCTRRRKRERGQNGKDE